MARTLVIFTAMFFIGPMLVRADTINACVKQSNGKLRVVADPAQCKANEGAISWNSEGPKGDPGDSQCVAAPALREFALVGVTTATSGGFDVPWELDELCGTEFQGSRVCRQFSSVTTLAPGLNAAAVLAAIAPIVTGGPISGGAQYLQNADDGNCFVAGGDVSGRLSLVGVGDESPTRLLTLNLSCATDLNLEERPVACCAAVR